jgi:hypothetical protein
MAASQPPRRAIVSHLFHYARGLDGRWGHVPVARPRTQETQRDGRLGQRGENARPVRVHTGDRPQTKSSPSHIIAVDSAK